MTELRNDSTHPQLTEPVSLLVIYESVGKGLLIGASMTQGSRSTEKPPQLEGQLIKMPPQSLRTTELSVRKNTST